MGATKEEKGGAETHLANITADLEKETHEHAMEVSSLERRNVMEKERLKNEMLKKIRETRMSLLAMTEDQLHATTKRTIMENDQMTTELTTQSKETERLLKLNNKLVKENGNLRRQMELNDQARTMLVRRAGKLQDSINSLNEILSKRQKKRIVVKRTDDLSKDVAETERIIKSLETRLVDLDSMNRQIEDDTAVLRAQLADSREANTRMLGLQDEALTFTLMVFEQVKSKLGENLKPEKKSQGQGTGTVLPPLNGGGIMQQQAGSTYADIHSKLQMVATGENDLRRGSRGDQEDDELADGEMKLSNLATVAQRDIVLDLLIKKLNTYSSEQLKLITQH